MSNNKTQKKYKFNKYSYGPIINKNKQDKMKLFGIIKQVNIFKKNLIKQK